MFIPQMAYFQGYMSKNADAEGDIIPPQGQQPQQPMQTGATPKATAVDAAIEKAQATVSDSEQKAKEATVMAEAEKAKLQALIQSKEMENALVPGGMPKAASENPTLAGDAAIAGTGAAGVVGMQEAMRRGGRMLTDKNPNLLDKLKMGNLKVPLKNLSPQEKAIIGSNRLNVDSSLKDLLSKLSPSAANNSRVTTGLMNTLAEIFGSAKNAYKASAAEMKTLPLLAQQSADATKWIGRGVKSAKFAPLALAAALIAKRRLGGKAADEVAEV